MFPVEQRDSKKVAALILGMILVYVVMNLLQ
jgi:hypothetical protein